MGYPSPYQIERCVRALVLTSGASARDCQGCRADTVTMIPRDAIPFRPVGTNYKKAVSSIRSRASNASKLHGAKTTCTAWPSIPHVTLILVSRRSRIHFLFLLPWPPEVAMHHPRATNVQLRREVGLSRTIPCPRSTSIELNGTGLTPNLGEGTSDWATCSA